MLLKRKLKKSFIIILFIISFFCLSFGIILYVCGPIERNSEDVIELTIDNGTTSSQIANILKDKGLIRSTFLFKAFIKLYNVNSLKASTYQFSKSMSMKDIIFSMEKGSKYNPDMIKLTFREGLRVTDYINVIANNTNNSYDDVLNAFQDREYLNTLINKYWFLSDQILSDGIYYPLEGYLYPETYYFDNKDVSVREVIETMLDEMSKNLEKYKDSLEKDVHYYLTMASIVELEGTNTDNRKKIVGVFNNRLNRKMNLGSDVTTYYGLQLPQTRDLTKDEFDSVNLYNTRSVTMIGKMPIGPICNPSSSSIEASVFPIDSNYLFFVADKNGKIYFTETNKEHEQKIKEIKASGNWIW